MNENVGLRQRVDKWLFFARIVKSRSLAAALANNSKVRVNRDKIDRAAYGLRIGDILTVSLRERILVLKVIDLGERRGSATEARLLYEDISSEHKETENTARIQSGGPRPTKRDRRKLKNLKPMYE